MDRPLLGSDEPAVLRGLARGWGCSSWTPERFAEEFGSRCLWCSVGCEERSGSTRKERMRLDALVRLLRSGRGAGPAPYLKQVDVLRAFPSVRRDFLPQLRAQPFLPRSAFATTYLWMGGRGAVTGLHNDDEDNFIIQCHGTKRVHLYAPRNERFLYVNTKFDAGTRCADVDVAAPDLRLHPLFSRAELFGGAPLDLSPGDVLFIPKYWWHAVETVSEASISLNAFVSTPVEYATRGTGRAARQVLHDYFGWRRGNCVCHAAEGDGGAHLDTMKRS